MKALTILNESCEWLVSQNASCGGEQNLRGCLNKATKKVGKHYFCTRHAKQAESNEVEQ